MAKGEDITTKFKVDVSDLKKGITEANNQMKLANAQFKATAAGMDNWATSSEGLKAKLTQLASVLSAQNSKLENYKKQLQAIETTEGKNAQRADELKAKMQELASQGVSKTSAEYKKYQTALSAVEKEQLANKSAADSLKVTILNQQGAVNSTQKEIRNYTKTLSELDLENADVSKSNNGVNESLKGVGAEAGKAEGKVGILAKGLGKGLAAAAIAGVAAATAGLIAITKEAISNYAEYEQLVGGVDTLFKDSSKKVQEYASQAYKTAGLSANEYMSTVTSFSASLLQSLGGDTAKAADVANMALIDMSDNANKMGSDMASIQNAYQGFAKQNYTMLDNLKLGYGGTKEEMQRLLVDAQKLTGVKYDITNLNDVYQAIHVIQGELGITGTTAKEASTTIQGSIGSLKAAWTNLMTGMADETQNFDQLLTNVIDSVGSVITNLLPRVSVVVSNVFKLVEGLLPEVVKLIQQLLPEIVNGVSILLNGLIGVLPQVVDAVVDVIPQIVQALLSALPQLLTAVIEIVTNVLTGLGEILPQIITAVVEIIPQIVQALIDGIPVLLNGAIQFLMAIIDAVPTIIQALTTALPQIIDTVVTGLINALPQIIQGALQLLMGIVDAIPLIIEALVPEIPKIVMTIISVLIENLPALIEGAVQLMMGIVQAIPQIVLAVIQAAPQIVQGLIEGLLSGVGQLGNAVKTLGSTILNGIKSFFGIHSPSTVMEDQGDYLVKGMLNGLEALPEKALAIFNNLFTQVSDWGVALATKATEIATNFLTNMINFISQLPSKIWTNLSSTINKVIQFSTKMVNLGKDIATKFLNNIINKVKELPSKLWSIFTSAISKVTSWSSQMVSKGKQAATNLLNNVVNIIKSMPSKIANVGKNIVTGIWNGISGATTWLKNKIKSWVGQPIKWAKQFLGISSPSKRFADEVGKFIPSGFAMGIEKNTKPLTSSIKNMANKAVKLSQNLLGDMEVPSLNVSSGLAGAVAGAGGTSNVNNFTQIINAPKSPSRAEIYRDTKNLLALKGGV